MIEATVPRSVGMSISTDRWEDLEEVFRSRAHDIVRALRGELNPVRVSDRDARLEIHVGGVLVASIIETFA